MLPHPMKKRSRVCRRLNYVPELGSLTALILASFLGSSLVFGASPKLPFSGSPPRPLREMRGAWVATVANLDWPSKPGLSTSEQKLELTGLLDKAVQLNLNV